MGLVDGVVSRLPWWPSPRAQWSAFFATLLLIYEIRLIRSAEDTVVLFTIGFLLCYFPLAWVYRVTYPRARHLVFGQSSYTTTSREIDE